jgi:hypothetical protein
MPLVGLEPTSNSPEKQAFAAERRTDFRHRNERGQAPRSLDKRLSAEWLQRCYQPAPLLSGPFQHSDATGHPGTGHLRAPSARPSLGRLECPSSVCNNKVRRYGFRSCPLAGALSASRKCAIQIGDSPDSEAAFGVDEPLDLLDSAVQAPMWSGLSLAAGR